MWQVEVTAHFPLNYELVLEVIKSDYHLEFDRLEFYIHLATSVPPHVGWATAWENPAQADSNF